MGRPTPRGGDSRSRRRGSLGPADVDRCCTNRCRVTACGIHVRLRRYRSHTAGSRQRWRRMNGRRSIGEEVNGADARPCHDPRRLTNPDRPRLTSRRPQLLGDASVGFAGPRGLAVADSPSGQRGPIRPGRNARTPPIAAQEWQPWSRARETWQSPVEPLQTTAVVERAALWRKSAPGKGLIAVPHVPSATSRVKLPECGLPNAGFCYYR